MPEIQQDPAARPDESIVEMSDYQSVNVFAIAALLVGLASVLAFIHPLLWSIPVVAIGLSGVALYLISHSAGAQVGRKIALVGLAAALALGAAALSKQFVFQWAVQREAQTYCQLWFDLLARGEPHKAHQLANSPLARQRLDSDLWEHYRNVPDARTSLHGFVEQPMVRALLELGDQTDVQLFESFAETRKRKTTVLQIYSVSYHTPDGIKTFFCSMNLERTRDSTTGNAEWRLVDFQGAIPSPFEEL